MPAVPTPNEPAPAARVFSLGEFAATLETALPTTDACQARIWQLAEAMRKLPSLRDVVPGMNNLTVVVPPGSELAANLPQWLLQQWQAMAQKPLQQRKCRVVEVPVQYGGADGPDLADVAAHAGMSPQEVVALHSAAEYTVYFLGFLPGFSYMGGLDARLATPRRATPRLQIPAGSVGIGGAQTGIYPLDSPGGWQLIGRTPLTLFDPARAQPSLLQPGDTVRFVPLEPDAAAPVAADRAGVLPA